MAYTIPEKLKRLEIYEPVTEIYDIRLDANESFQICRMISAGMC